MRENTRNATAGRSGLNRMIQKIIFYRKKNLALFFLLFLVSMLLIAAYLLYDYTDRAMKKSDGERLYGTYDIRILAESSEMEEAILANENILDHLAVKTWKGDWNTDETAVWYAVGNLFDEFFTMTNYELTAGKYPTQADEILCEDEFLSLNGYYFDRDGEAEVEINGETWHVTGTFTEHESLRDAYEVYSPTFLTAGKVSGESIGDNAGKSIEDRNGENAGKGAGDRNGENNAGESIEESNGDKAGEDAEIWLYLDVGDAVTGEVEEEIRKACESGHGSDSADVRDEDGDSGLQIYTNSHYLESTNQDRYGNTTLPWLRLQKIMGYVILVLLLYLLSQIAWLSLKEKTHDFAVLMSHGVTPGKITVEYARILLLAALVDLAAVLAVSFLCFVILTGGWKLAALFTGGTNSGVSVSGNLYADVGFWPAALRILAADGIFSALVTASVLLRCQRLLSAKIGGNISATLANRENIRVKRPERKRRPRKVFDGEPGLIPPLAENMMRKKRGAYLLFSVSIILGLLMMDMYSYVVGEILPKNYVTDYAYRTKYIYNTDLETILGIEGMDETYQSIQNSGLADLLPLYCVQTRLNFKLADLEKNCRNYLKNSDDTVAGEISAGRASVDVRCIVLGVDADTLEKLCGIKTEFVADTDCYVLADIEEENGRAISLGLEEGSVIRLTETQESITGLTVRGLSTDIHAMQDAFYGKPVVMVSMPVYEALAYENYGYTYPTWLYLNCADGVSDSKLTDYFRSLSNILLVDNASEVRNTKRLWFQTMVPIYFMGACLLVSLLTNVYMVLNSSYEENRSQLAMLSALGVNEKGMVSLQLRLNWRVFFRSAVLGNALAVGACYLVFRVLIEYDTYAEFLPPCGMMMITTALVAAVFIGVSAVMRKKIRGMNVVEELSSEAS